MSFFGNNGSVTDGSNQLTIGGSTKDVALEVRGGMSGDIVGVGPVFKANETAPLTVGNKKFPADITSTTFDKTKYTVKTGYDFGKLDNAVGTNPGDPSMATVDSVAKHSTDASKLTLTLSGDVAVHDYATVTVTDTVGLAQYTKQVYQSGADVSAASKNLDLSSTRRNHRFHRRNAVGFGTTADNTFQLATGGFDTNTPAGAVTNYTAFGGAGNDVASGIDSADVFIGGAHADTAKVLFGFQDYKFDDVAPGDTAYDAMVDTALVNGAGELVKTTGEVTALKENFWNVTTEPETTDAVQVGGAPVLWSCD